MSLSASLPGIARPQVGVETGALLAIVWLATVATYLVAGLSSGLSTDDAMRIVQVRDFLAGQSWFDVTQYRLDPPDGVVMHWSRLIDLPLAVLIRIGEMVETPALAARIAAFVWPASLLLLFLLAVARLAQNLAGDAAARLALIFAALTAPVLQHFRPGAIDHHNVQLVLLLASLAFAARGDLRARDGALAGALSALSLAIGLEMTPAITAIAAAITLRWIWCGEMTRPATTAFALTFAAGALLLAAATIPPAHYPLVACDAFSIVHVSAAAVGGIGLATLSFARGLSSRWSRCVGAGVLAVLLAALLIFAFPACLADPYAALDPRLVALWLANVNEARGVLSLMRDLPQEVLAYYGLGAAGLVLCVVQCARETRGERWSWITASLTLLALFVIALWQLRGSAAANAVALALVPAALVRIFPTPRGRAVYFGLGRAALIAALLLNPAALIAAGNAGARALESASIAQRRNVISDGPATCGRANDYAPLARLPRGLVLGFIDAGPFILMESPHAVLAAPYHRNVKGNVAMLDVFLATPGEAARKLAALRVDYLAFCPGAPERHNYAVAAPDGLAAALARGDAPTFLERIPLDGTEVALYRVRQ